MRLILLLCLTTLGLALPLAAQDAHPLAVDFEGRQSLSASKLKRAMELELDRFRDSGRESALDDAAFLLEEAYLAEGFDQVEVDWRVERQAKEAHAIFTIREGRRLRLGALRFEGAEAIAPEALAGLLGAPLAGNGDQPFRRQAVNALPGAIRDAYWGLGYLETKVEGPLLSPPQDDRIAVSYRLTEGRAFHLVEVSGGEDGPLGPTVITDIAAPWLGKAYFPRRRVELEQALQRRYALAGFPNAKVQGKASTDEDGSVHLKLALDAGPLTTISAVEVEGLDRSNPAFVREHFGVASGDRYDQAAIDEGFLKLFRTGLFHRIQIELGEEAGAQGQRPLILTLEESPAKEWDLSTGYGSYEGFRLGSSYTDRNLFGSGRQGRLNADGSQVGWAVETGWTDPWFLKRDLTLDLPLFLRRRREPSFTREEFGLGWNLRHEFRPTFDLSGGWSFRRSSISAVTVQTSAEVQASDLDIASFFLQPEFDSRNDVFNPSKGALARLRLEWAGDQLLGGDLAFMRSRLDLSHLQPLTQDGSRVLAVGGRLGIAWPLGGTSRLPLQERFFNGGEDSVRSFREGELGPLDVHGEPLGGESFYTANLELRQAVAGNLWASAFVDGGHVGLRAGDVVDDIDWGLGVGLRYLLPVGALRLDAAWNPNPGPQDADYQVFLTVGLAF